MEKCFREVNENLISSLKCFPNSSIFGLIFRACDPKTFPKRNELNVGNLSNKKFQNKQA